MRIDYAVLADGAVQRPDGKLDIFGAGWDTLTAQAVPHVHGSFDVALRLVIPADEAREDHLFELIVQGPDGEEAARARTEMVFNSESASSEISEEKFAMTFNFRGVVFPVEGPYQLVLVMDGSELQALSFSVAVAPND
jgi:hypothetical protein